MKPHNLFKQLMAVQNKTMYKFLRTGLLSDNGKNREWEIGKWRKEEKIDICHEGFHASENPAHALSHVKGEILALVEVRGESIINDDKQCWSEMRIKKAWHWKKEDFVAFAIYSAEQVIDIFEKQYPNDDRPRNAIEAAKEYLKNPTQKNYYAADAAARAADDSSVRAATYADTYAAYDSYDTYAAARAATYAADAAAYAARAAARASTYATYASAYAAYAAAYAARAVYAATYADTYAATYAADAAAYAARAAARASTYASDAAYAAYADIWKKLGEWIGERIKSLEEYK